jgi:hypothetical protein
LAVSRAAQVAALCWSKEQGTSMSMKMMTFAGALALAGCGGLHEAPDMGGTGGTGYGASPPKPVGGTGFEGGGFEAGGYGTGGTGVPTGGTRYEGGGYEAGGYGTGGTGVPTGGTGYEGGGYEAGGYEAGGVGFAGTAAGGYETGGTGSLPSDEWTCLQNVSHCFNAAANCYEYSPWSDCDQIVDVCSAMQETCDALSP